MTDVNDPINPQHYHAADGRQAIDVIESFGLNYNLGSACKYLLRAGRKGSKREDLMKCRWFIDREIARLDE
jgi:Protein of unknwon function (DUF3310)